MDFTNHNNVKRLAFRAENAQSYVPLPEARIDGATMRYITPRPGLRVWEDGRIVLMHSGFNEPGLRDDLMRCYGIELLMLNESPTLYYGDKKIPRTWLQNVSTVLVDNMTPRVVHPCRSSDPRKGLAWWDTAHSVVRGAAPFKLHIPNKDAKKLWLELNEEFILRAKGIAALDGGETRIKNGIQMYNVYDIATQADHPQQHTAMIFLGRMASLMNEQWKNLVDFITCDKVETLYLSTKPGPIITDGEDVPVYDFVF